MAIELLNPILDGGVYNTNFFNGRLLTAEDLKTEQNANRQHHQQLGRAIGAGVVSGLEVGFPGGAIKGGTTLMVTPGLAINRKGQTIALNTLKAVEVDLVEKSEVAKKAAGLFADCKALSTETLTGPGIYILLISTASEFKGRAPMSGLDANGKITGCGKRYEVEGVQFRFVSLDYGLDDDTKEKLVNLRTTIEGNIENPDLESISKLRNIAAHACFGTEEKAEFAKDPFKSLEQVEFGAIDQLRSLEDSPNKITDCDVPLAMIYWTSKGIKFIDMWSVRRRPFKKLPSTMWPFLINERRLAEAEGVFLQFQEHLGDIILLIDSLVDTPGTVQLMLRSVNVIDFFRFLPPVGLLPLRKGYDIYGFDIFQFFLRLPYREPAFIDYAQVHPLIRESLNHDPIDLSKGEMVWLYKVWQNEHENGSNQPFVIFASAYMPNISPARFDVSHWDYSKFT